MGFLGDMAWNLVMDPSARNWVSRNLRENWIPRAREFGAGFLNGAAGIRSEASAEDIARCEELLELSPDVGTEPDLTYPPGFVVSGLVVGLLSTGEGPAFTEGSQIHLEAYEELAGWGPPIDEPEIKEVLKEDLPFGFPVLSEEEAREQQIGAADGWSEDLHAEELPDWVLGTILGQPSPARMLAAWPQRVDGLAATFLVVIDVHLVPEEPMLSAPPAGSRSAIEEIRELAEMHAAGILTDEEFATLKKAAIERSRA